MIPGSASSYLTGAGINLNFRVRAIRSMHVSCLGALQLLFLFRYCLLSITLWFGALQHRFTIVRYLGSIPSSQSHSSIFRYILPLSLGRLRLIFLSISFLLSTTASVICVQPSLQSEALQLHYITPVRSGNIGTHFLAEIFDVWLPFVHWLRPSY